MKTVPYLTFVALILGSSTVTAECLSRPDITPECRYPQGDTWCIEKDSSNPYAYTDTCLKKQNTSKTTQENRTDLSQNITFGRCHMDNCSWAKTLDKRSISSNSCGELIQVKILSGESENESNASPSRPKISWNTSPHIAYLFCSKYLPSVITEYNNEYQVDILNFWNGIPGAYESGANLYREHCHPGSSKNMSDEQLAKKYQYNRLPDTNTTIQINQPLDILQIAQSHFNCQPKKTKATTSTTTAQLLKSYQGWWRYPDNKYSCNDEDNQYRVALGTYQYNEKLSKIVFGQGTTAIGLYDESCVLSNGKMQGQLMQFMAKCTLEEGEKISGTLSIKVRDQNSIAVRFPHRAEQEMLLIRCPK